MKFYNAAEAAKMLHIGRSTINGLVNTQRMIVYNGDRSKKEPMLFTGPEIERVQGLEASGEIRLWRKGENRRYNIGPKAADAARNNIPVHRDTVAIGSVKAKHLYSTKAAGDLFGVSAPTFLNWADQGVVKSIGSREVPEGRKRRSPVHFLGQELLDLHELIKLGEFFVTSNGRLVATPSSEPVEATSATVPLGGTGDVVPAAQGVPTLKEHLAADEAVSKAALEDMTATEAARANPDTTLALIERIKALGPMPSGVCITVRVHV